MSKLVVLNYSNGTVNIHNISDNKDYEEELLEDLGYSETDCEWMIGDNLKINFYD